jgi:hypothetical protein
VFLGQWSANAILEPLLAGAVGGEILARSFETERAIRSTSDHGGVLIVLTVILPEAHLADIEPAAFAKGQEAATRARPPRPRHCGPRNRVLIESPNVSIKPPPTSLEFLGGWLLVVRHDWPKIPAFSGGGERSDGTAP